MPGAIGSKPAGLADFAITVSAAPAVSIYKDAPSSLFDKN